jgi:chromosome partitioning protein
MKTVALVTQKGGSGKTTIATNLAVAAAKAGETVALLDLDPQGSTAAWGALRKAEDIAVEALEPEQIAQLPVLLKSIETRFSLVILDTAGIDSPAVRAAMGTADLCLLPIRSTRLDYEAVKPTIRALLRGDHRFAFAVNQAQIQPGNMRAADMMDSLKAVADVAIPAISSRVAYQDAFGEGLGVIESDPDGRAASEIKDLWGWVARALQPAKKGVF